VKTALIIGAAAVGVYVLYRYAQGQSTVMPVAPVATRPPTLSERADQVASAIVNRTGRAFVELATGTSSSGLKTFGEQSDFEALKYLMCNCYKRGPGNHNSCQAVQQMAPGTKCEGGNCDCDPAMTGTGKFTYRHNGSSHSGSFGPKTLATAWTNDGEPRVAAAAPGEVFVGPTTRGIVNTDGGGAWRAK
jgi:hypothetical protein